MESLITELEFRNYSRRTVKNYVHYNKMFLQFVGKAEHQINNNDVKRYVNTLSGSTKHSAIAALKFYYNQVLNRNVLHNVRYPKKKQSLPVILSHNEVLRMIEVTTNAKHKLLIQLLYGCGLRVSEVVKLKYSDVDNDRKILYVNGKGNKDRIVTIPFELIGSGYIFYTSNGHITTRTAQEIVKSAKRKADISKKVTCHSLRHSYATHLLENGVDIRHIQKLLGHSKINTTMIYTKVANDQLIKIKSPL